MKTQVAIIGAGLFGPLLGQLLHRTGGSSVRSYVSLPYQSAD